MAVIGGPAARVLALALLSRVLVLGGMILATAAFSDLDTSARLQVRPCNAAGGNGAAAADAPPAPGAVTPPLAVWDAIHFVRVAKCGYETDMLGAFFPALPAVMRAWQQAAAGEPASRPHCTTGWRGM